MIVVISGALLGCVDGVGDVATCSAETRLAMIEPATAADPTVSIACDIALRPGDVVTRRIVIEGSQANGMTLDCNGALLDGGEGTVNEGRDMIQVRSVKVNGAQWDPPADVTVQDCRIIGSVRTLGMGNNGEAGDVKASSFNENNHVRDVRAAAPTRIRFEGLDVEGVGRTPFYVAPGVTYVTLENSRLHGEAESVGLYLDAESAYNTIRGNRLEVDTRETTIAGITFYEREQMAIDGSSWNLVIDNWLSSLDNGGIYLYRNCGEGGTVRHSTPSHNVIVDNVFFYREYDGSAPSVYVGARNGGFFRWLRYCRDDNDYDFGSGADDRDFAQFNVVAQNQIYKLAVNDMIKVGESTDSDNLIVANQSVTEALNRPTGCGFFVAGYPQFLGHGAETHQVPDQIGGTILTQKPGQVITGRFECDNGALRSIPLEAQP
jgi:hypothetical protein